MPGDLTVVMPLFDCEPYVDAAIDSVLARADGLLELLVVDDGSTDGGPAIAAAYGPPVRLIGQPNAGPAAARNRGLAEARGTIIGFLDADDVWLAGRPDPRRPALDAGAEVVCARVQPMVGGPEGLVAQGPATGGLQLGAVWVRREVVERHGGLDETRRYSEDVDWLLRLRDAGARFALVGAVTAGYRRRPGSPTRDRAATDAGLTRALAASLRRRGHLGR